MSVRSQELLSGPDLEDIGPEGWTTRQHGQLKTSHRAPLRSESTAAPEARVACPMCLSRRDKRAALRQKSPLMIRVLCGLEQSANMIKILNGRKGQNGRPTSTALGILVLCRIRDERSFMLIPTHG